MRKFLCLLLGTATVVGFEVTFGLSKWKPWQPNPYLMVPPRSYHDINMLPGGITYVRNIKQIGNGFLVGID